MVQAACRHDKECRVPSVVSGVVREIRPQTDLPDELGDGPKSCIPGVRPGPTRAANGRDRHAPPRLEHPPAGPVDCR